MRGNKRKPRRPKPPRIPKVRSKKLVKGRCRATGKIRYVSRSVAVGEMIRINAAKKTQGQTREIVDVYRCHGAGKAEESCGGWHLSSVRGPDGSQAQES